jgi:hypothetical protein
MATSKPEVLTRQAGAMLNFVPFVHTTDVGKCYNRTGIVENLGVAVGIAFLPCSQLLISVRRVQISVSCCVPLD